jgi:hypothetical protein
LPPATRTKTWGKVNDHGFPAGNEFVASSALGGVLIPALVLFGLLPPFFVTGILPLSLLGELFERYLFFTAVVPPKMPGGIAS